MDYIGLHIEDFLAQADEDGVYIYKAQEFDGGTVIFGSIGTYAVAFEFNEYGFMTDMNQVLSY